MGINRKGAVTVAVIAAGGLVAGSAAGQSQKVTGPIADYWVSAATTSGMMGGMGAGGGRPGMGAMMGMAMGRGGGHQHTLNLQLGSTQAPAGAAQADHLPPTVLGAGPALPLLTPQRYTPPPTTPSDPRPPNMQKPEGRMLIYWGCGEHAAAGQPVVIDFAKISAGQFPSLQTINVRTDTPPSPERYKTYGEWPNERTRTQVPPTGSLVGSHSVKGNYSPQIDFSLGPNQDFLAPLNITGQQPTPAGGTRLSWNAVPQSTGYFAWLMGADSSGGRGAQTTMVMWTSSNAQSFMGALMDYIPPSEARRLVAAGAVMSPQTTTCTIPAEVVKASPTGLLSMIAYGDEVNLSDPPRPASAKLPWNISWRVKVRYKSTTGTILGRPGMGGMGGDEDERPQRRGRQEQQEPAEKPSVGRAIGGALMRRGLGF